MLFKYSVNMRHWNDARNWVSPENALHNIPICMSKRVVKKNNDEEWLVQCANTSLDPIS
jgi:hypothetical protein